MSFDFSTLVTDRSQADVDRIRELIAKGWAAMTPEEQQAFNAATSKGSYNYTDLNRVTAAMDYINNQLVGYGYQTGYQRVEVPHQKEPVSPLPDGYTQLAWIESSGTQYVDTGVYPNQDISLEMEFAPTDLSKTEWWFGVRSSSNTNMFGFYSTSATSVYSTFASSGQTFSIPSIEGQTVSLEKGDAITTLRYGNNVEELENTDGTFTSEFALVLLSANLAGSIASSTRASGRLYSCAIYDGSSLIRNFVPCLNPSNVAGLYDLVNGVFYGNAGTGAFTDGPEVEAPDEPTEELDPYTWYESDIPTESLMTAYLSNVEAIRSVLEVMSTTPETPENMEALTWVGANNIEQILVDVETVISRVVNGMARSNSFTFWSGNRPFPTAESNLGRNWAELDAMNTGWENWQVATWYLLLYGNLQAEGVVS